MRNVLKSMQKSRVVVYGGSFDPHHLSHVSVINCLINSENTDETWVIPCGDRADKNMILSGI